jgi:hypothetical protein
MNRYFVILKLPGLFTMPYVFLAGAKASLKLLLALALRLLLSLKGHIGQEAV